LESLIINRPKAGQVFKNEKTFTHMVHSLALGGISARYTPMYKERQLLDTLSKENVEIAFSADTYLANSTNAWVNIHRLFEEMHVPYVGSSPEVLELVLSKARLKQVWLQKGIQTPEFTLIRQDQPEESVNALLTQLKNFPYILKPDSEGNSRGLSELCVVYDQATLLDRAKQMLATYPTLLVEHFLGDTPDLHEFTVAMIGNGPDKLLLPARIRLKNKKPVRVITTADKDNHNTTASPVADETIKERLLQFIGPAFDAAGVRDYARCDVLYANDQFYAIEINGQPMIPDKWFEACSKEACLDADQYLNAIFLAGIVRNQKNGVLNSEIPAQMRQCLPKPVFAALTHHQIEAN
jgi:D-alanine-D-alanine ligase